MPYCHALYLTVQGDIFSSYDLKDYYIIYYYIIYYYYILSSFFLFFCLINVFRIFINGHVQCKRWSTLRLLGRLNMAAKVSFLEIILVLSLV